MLSANGEREPLAASDKLISGEDSVEVAPSCTPKKWPAKIFCVEWLGQTLASLCWIASVLTYGITVPGDWLQLCAASAWLVANIASALTDQKR